MIKKESVTEQFIGNSFWGFLLMFVTKIGGLLFTLIIARFLMPELFGAYSFILAIAMIFMALGDLGINQTLVILMSKNLEDKKKTSSYFKFLMRIKIILLLIISLAFIVIGYFISSSSLANYSSIKVLIFCSIYILFFSLSGFFSSIFYIYRNVKKDFFKESVFQISRLFLIGIVLFIFPSGYKLLGLFAVLALSAFVSFLYSYYQSKKLYPSIYSKIDYNQIDKTRIYKLLLYFMIGTLSLILFSEIDILMIGLLIKNLVYVGYYRAYFAIILGISGLFGFASILLPIFSSFENNRLKVAFDKVSKYILILAVPACFGLFSLGAYFIKFLYGDNYLPGTFILYFLAPLIISESITGLFNTVISSRERPKIIAVSLAISIVLNVLLIYTLVSIFINKSLILAVSGAAISTLVTRYFFMICLWVYSNKHLKITIPLKNIFKPLISSIIMGLVLYIVSKNINMNLFLGGLLIFMGIVVYFIFMFLIGGLVKEDKIILELLYRKIKRNLNLRNTNVLK